jgi:hypothetical protein
MRRRATDSVSPECPTPLDTPFFPAARCERLVTGESVLNIPSDEGAIPLGEDNFIRCGNGDGKSVTLVCLD